MPERIGRIPLRKQVTELDMSYYAAQKELGRTLLSVDVANYSELAAMRAQKDIEGQIRKLNRTAIRWSKESVPMAYKESYLIAKTRLEILGAERDIYFDTEKHRNSMDKYIELTAEDLIKANQSIKVNVTLYLYFVRQAVQGIMQLQAFDYRSEEFISSLLDEALRKGATRGWAQKAIMGHLKIASLDGQFIRINGRNYNMEKYADMVAKTRLRYVQSEAVKNSCEQFDNDLIEISSHGTDCTICLPWEGNVYSISGKTKGYPYLEAWPPFHPRCQHHARPTSEVALLARHIFH